MTKFLGFLKKYSIFIILLAIMLYGVFGVKLFIKPKNIFNLMMNTCLYGIPAVGMTFIMLTGNIDLSVGRNVALGSILSCIFCTNFGFVPGLLLTIVVCMLVSYGTAHVVTKFRIDPLITTLGIQVIIEGASQIITGERTVKAGSPALAGLFEYKLFGILPMPMLIFGAMLVASLIVTNYTKFGINIYVAGGNKEAGRMSGINVARLERICWLIAGFSAGIGGAVLASRVGAGSTILGNTLNLTTIASCVVGGVSFSGGKGNHLRMIAGVLVIQTMNNIMSLKGIVGTVQSFVTGLVLVLVLILDRYTSAQGDK